MLPESIHGEAAGDPVGEVARRRVAKVVDERALPSRVIGDGDHREQVRAERLACLARVVSRTNAIGLVEVPNMSDEVGLGVGDDAFHGKPTVAARDDVRATVD